MASVVALLAVLASIVRSSPKAVAAVHCYAGVLTLDPHNVGSGKSANCFEVSSGGVFSRVFSSLDNKRVDNGYVVPGLWDGHGHLLQYGEYLDGVDLFGANSLADSRDRVVNYAKKNPETGTRSEWIRGVGWDQSAYGGKMPTAV